MKDLDRKGNNQSGSLKNSEPEFLVAGKLRKSHGLSGEMWIEVLTDHPELLQTRVFLFLLVKALKKTSSTLFGWLVNWD